MKRILSVILAILVCCMSFVSVLGVSAADADTSKKLSVSSNTEDARYLVDGNGNPVHLFGMARYQRAAQEGKNEEAIDASVMAKRYKDLGLNYMRLAINLNDIAGETIADPLALTKNEEIDSWIEAVVNPDVQNIIGQGMYVGLDLHEYQPNVDADGNALEDSAESAAAIIDYAEANYLPVLKRLANYYKDEPMIANIEIWNEPNYVGGPAPSNANWEPALRQYFVDAVTEIRGVGFDGVIIVSDGNAGWQNTIATTWGGHYEDLYVGGNRNIAFSQHISGKQLDPNSTDDEGNLNYAPQYAETNALAMDENLCIIFNEVEAECPGTNSTEGIEAFCEFLDETKETFNYSACLWRPRTDYINRVWVWGTNGWAANYTGGTLVRTTTNWFAPDGSTSDPDGDGWADRKYNFPGNGNSIVAEGGVAVGGEPEFAKVQMAKTRTAGWEIQFGRDWYHNRVENNTLDTLTPTDLTGYDYVIVKIKFPDEERATYALTRPGAGDAYIRLDDNGPTASFEDYKLVLESQAAAAKAGEWVTLALPLSEAASGVYSLVYMDPDYEWRNTSTSETHIGSIDFATAEYVAANYADYTPEAAQAIIDEMSKNTPLTVNWFTPSKLVSGGGAGQTYVKGDNGDCMDGAFGPSMNEADGYAFSDYFVNKSFSFSHGQSGTQTDLTGMTYIKLQIKFTPDYVDEAIGYINTGTLIDIGGATVSGAALKASLTKQNYLMKAGKYATVVLPFSTAISGSYERFTMQLTTQWKTGYRFYINSIDFANDIYAEANWSDSMTENIVAPAQFKIFNPPCDGNEYTDYSYGVKWGGDDACAESKDPSGNGKVFGVKMPAPADHVELTTIHNTMHFRYGWMSWKPDLTGYSHLVLKIKFHSKEAAEYALANMEGNGTNVFTTVGGATITYDQFKEAMNAKSYELLQADEYVDIVMAFDKTIEGTHSGAADLNFDFKWTDKLELKMDVAAVDLVNTPYVDLYLTEEFIAENVNLKLNDGPDYKFTTNPWDPQLSIAAKESVAVHSSMTSITMDLKASDIETIYNNITYSSRGSTTGEWSDAPGSAFAIYFDGTGVTGVGVTKTDFTNALTDEIRASLAAGERVSVTFPLSGEFTSGSITALKIMIAHSDKSANINGLPISISHIYFNYNAETFPEYDEADLDLDGNVSAADYTIVKKAIFETEVDIDNFNYGDVNADGKVDILDCIIIKNKTLEVA